MDLHFDAGFVLPLGDPRLRLVAAPVDVPLDHALTRACERLYGTLEAFRSEHGFGRGIAAPQIAVSMRLIALHIPGMPHILCNPEIAWRSEETFTLWDDCMCFPDLLVRVRRNRSISVRWQDVDGKARLIEKIAEAESELLQHEIDHLDGILAVDRAEGKDAIVRRAAFEADPSYFNQSVDSPR